ncbi:alpha/beta hydrolase [Rivularia sp. UHCC 0363]|uniref:alpha/beta hydrolase n=1 Tax=Rivularia sp. UHCC 0363 TaxID=3110244 RepID=UPI002B1ECBB7|nr:alpha/beta hydrolase [Rivularia sp. UHCC 0363]MEA5594595.1 alpha/beta hydrolase [Rivularia sp. UHCC 0363]
MLFKQKGKSSQRLLQIKGLLCGLTFACCTSLGIPSASAAQTVTIRLGPFEQSVAIADLEEFAKTGKLPTSLQGFSAFLPSGMQELLQRRLSINPQAAANLTQELQKTSWGRQLITSLTAALPGSSIESVEGALSLALRQVNGLSVVGFLRAYPQTNVTVDATKAIGLAVELNPNRLQSQALGSLLARELFVNNQTESYKSNFNPATIGKEVVEQQTITLRDPKRNRSITVDIYASEVKQPQQPLVVISHGFGANRKYLAYLARHLASYGVSVAAIEHPGSNSIAINQARNTSDLKNLLNPNEFIDRPKDITFLLDELTKLNNQPGKLQGKLNTQQVSVIGHSLGGYTALAIVGGEVNIGQLKRFCNNSLNIANAPGDWLECAAATLPENKLQLRDERVKSAIALNPMAGKLFGDKGLSQINKPVLILTGTEDALTPALKHQIQPFNQLGGQKYLLTAIGGTHLSISDEAYAVNSATTIIKERRGIEARPLRELLKGVSVAFVKQLAPEAKNYQPFLTSAYAQSFSTSQIKLRLNSQLPASIKPWLEMTTR